MAGLAAHHRIIAILFKLVEHGILELAPAIQQLCTLAAVIEPRRKGATHIGIYVWAILIALDASAIALFAPAVTGDE